MRTFLLERIEDVSGVSGTGIVAEGVQFKDGNINLHWLGEHPSTESFTCLDDLLFVHGHSGKTKVRWVHTGEPEDGNIS